MGKIKAHEFMSLDGVVETPRWTFEFGFDPVMGGAIGGIMGNCKAILLGRVTYEMFAPVWSERSAEDDPGAPFMNETPKFVVSSTLTDPKWQGTTVLGLYEASAIRKLKEETDGDIYVSGSLTLAAALADDGLLDELHVFVYPTTRGRGRRLFDSVPPVGMALVDSSVYSNGVVYLSYQPAPSQGVSS